MAIYHDSLSERITYGRINSLLCETKKHVSFHFKKRKFPIHIILSNNIYRITFYKINHIRYWKVISYSTYASICKCRFTYVNVCTHVKFGSVT